jgi:peroxiredoxin Q/BCP
MLKIILITIMIGNLMANNALEIGDKAPDFTLIDKNNKVHTLSDYFGELIAVYFYPKDDTPGCTKEACSIRDNYSKFEEKGIIVFGISYDSPKSHKKFAEKYNLPFTLLSDSEKVAAKAYGSNGILMAKRNTYLIDRDGKIFKIYKDVDVTTHTQNILNDFMDLEKADEK